MQSARDHLAIPAQPVRLRWEFFVDGHPPAHHVAVGHYDARHVTLERAVIVLAEMQEIRFALCNHAFQILRGSLHISLRIEHPFQLERRGTIIKVGQIVHPAGLCFRRDIAKAHRGYAVAAKRPAP